jgi:esterase
LQLNAKQYSQAGQPLVMMHGLFGSLENLGAIAKPLASRYQVHSLDMRNHGRSPHADAMTLAQMAEDVLRYLDDHNIGQAAVLGHSLGGKVMMELALTAPERVTAVVVGDIAPVDYRVARHDDVFAGIDAVMLAQISNRTDADAQLAEHIQTPAVRSFILKNLYRTNEGEYFWRPNIAALKSNYRHIIGANRADTRFDGPVLFLKGEHSDYLQADHRPLINQLFPSAQLKVIGGTAHWLHAERPETFSKLVDNFLSGL